MVVPLQTCEFEGAFLLRLRADQRCCAIALRGEQVKKWGCSYELGLAGVL